MCIRDRHWPPSEQNPWYVQVTNADPDPGSNHAVLREVTLVRRYDPSSDLTVDAYPQKGLPLTIPPGTVEVVFPKTITVTSPNGGEHWTGGESRTVTWD